MSDKPMTPAERYAAEAESPELVAQIRECIRRIGELTE